MAENDAWLKPVEELGWKRLDALRERDREGFLQYVVSIASAEAGGGQMHVTARGVVLAAGLLSDTLWAAISRTACVVAKTAREEEMLFVELSSEALDVLKRRSREKG